MTHLFRGSIGLLVACVVAVGCMPAEQLDIAQSDAGASATAGAVSQVMHGDVVLGLRLDELGANVQVEVPSGALPAGAIDCQNQNKE